MCDVFLQVNKRTRLLGLFRVQSTLLEYHGYSLASQLPLDSGSGGIISLAAYAQQLGSAATSLPPGLLQQQQFCFTPTFSTLNITPASSAALTAQYSPGTSVGTPFANFRTAGRENEQHLDYTALNSTWMLKELRQTPQVLSCQAFCAATPTISGPDVVCGGSGSTFTVSGVPAGTLVTWSFATTVSVSTSANTGPSYTVTSAGATGSGTVQATLSSDCGQLTLAKPVIVGKPNPLVRKTSAANEPTTYEFTAPFLAGTAYRWYNGNTLIEDETSNVLLYYFPCKATRTISYAFANDCATSGTRPGLTLTGECRRAGAMALAPNPAADEVTVQAADEDPAPNARASTAPAAGPGIETVRLYDSYGRLRLEQAGRAARTLRLRVSALPTGLYVAHLVATDGTVSRQQLQISR